MRPTGKPLPTPAEFERQLAHFIDTLVGGATVVDRDTRLFEDGYMNSLRILDLIAVVEKTLGRRIPDRAVRLANFRTIAAIVSAFHPDVSAPKDSEAETVDRVFERRGNRARFASPVPALQQRGDLTITGPGQVALSGLALDVLTAVDRTVLRWAESLGAAEHRYPSIIDLGVLERAGQVQAFPQHLTLVGGAESTHAVIPSEGEESRSSRPDGPSTGSAPEWGQTPLNSNSMESDPIEMRFGPSLGMTTALAPAVCYHAYPEWEGKTLGATPEILTACGRCYRYEGANHVPLERLWEFTMREIIVLGAREQVETVRHSLVRQVSELVTMLDLDAAIVMATDPFFTAGDEGRRLMQQAGALKYELQLTVDATGRSVAAASFNHHHDFFGTRFAISLVDGSPAHTGCVAFGLERWVLAVLAQHGATEVTWPDAARAWLQEARDHARTSPQAPTNGARA